MMPTGHQDIELGILGIEPSTVWESITVADDVGLPMYGGMQRKLNAYFILLLWPMGHTGGSPKNKCCQHSILIRLRGPRQSHSNSPLWLQSRETKTERMGESSWTLKWWCLNICHEALKPYTCGIKKKNLFFLFKSKTETNCRRIAKHTKSTRQEIGRRKCHSFCNRHKFCIIFTRCFQQSAILLTWI